MQFGAVTNASSINLPTTLVKMSKPRPRTFIHCYYAEPSFQRRWGVARNSSKKFSNPLLKFTYYFLQQNGHPIGWPF